MEKEQSQGIIDLLEDIETSISTRSQSECPACHNQEWMFPVETMCWRCWRISNRLMVTLPNGEEGYCWWNYTQNKWVPLAHPPHGPEWGRRENYKLG